MSKAFQGVYSGGRGWKMYARLTKVGNCVRYTKYNKPVKINPRQYVEKTDAQKAENFLQRKSINSFRRVDNLAQARMRVYDIVAHNFNRYGRTNFVTFTYTENQSDINIAWKDWRRFVRRFSKSYHATLNYVVVVEFQKRGAVHFHALLFNLPDVFTNERETRRIAHLWTHGFVDDKKIDEIHSISAYITKYLSKDANDLRVKGRKFYACSRSMKRPTIHYNIDAQELFEEQNGEMTMTLDEKGNEHYIIKVHA